MCYNDGVAAFNEATINMQTISNRLEEILEDDGHVWMRDSDVSPLLRQANGEM